MSDPYYIDLDAFSLDKFRRLLETGEVLPGRRILKEQIPERFAVLESMGIHTLADLHQTLKTKKRVEKFAQECGLPLDYVVILRREANSYLPKPVNLRDFPDIDLDCVAQLEAVGVKHSKHLLERARTPEARAELCAQTGVPRERVLELVRLSDLARVNGVGPVFARLYVEAGIYDLDELLSRSPEALRQELLAINKAKGYTRAMVSLKDVVYCIEFAKELPRIIQYA
jgi:hypothetical protein